MKTFIIVAVILVLAIFIIAQYSSKENAIDMLIQWVIVLLIIVGALIFGISNKKDKESKNS